MLKKHLVETSQSQLTNYVTHVTKRNKKSGKKLRELLVSVGTENGMVAEVKDKCKSLHSTAQKKSFPNLRESRGRLEKSQVFQAKKFLKCLKKRQVSSA